MEHNKRKSEEKKSSDDIKGELLTSLIDIAKKDETGLHDAEMLKIPKKPAQ